MTLSRWANGESNPQKPHLLRLVQLVQPQYREELLTGLVEAYPDFQSWQKDETQDTIPSELFAEILDVRTTTTDALRFWRLSDMALKQALAQLDPNQLGMSITMVQCMPPAARHGNRIRSLRERAGRGTFPWTTDMEHMAMFLGVESLSGYAVESCHMVSIEDLRKEKLLPGFRTEFEVSAAAYPIMLGGRVAGCLLASSTQPGHFSQQRLGLLAALSDLVALAFEKEDFYPQELIELRVMPLPERQRPIIATFRQRVSRFLAHSALVGEHISNRTAEQRIWQEIEEELFELPQDAFGTLEASSREE